MKSINQGKNAENTAIIFLRAPIEGTVKTRLAASLDTHQVLNLYKGFVYDTLTTTSHVSNIVLYCWPPEKKEMISDWLGNKYSVFPQSGDDIGKKMANAFQEMFATGIRKAILIGTDIPDISQEIISRAFYELDRNDLVLAPAQDGGYYLIGFNNNTFSPSVFEGINWSTSTVMKETLAIVTQNRYRCHLLPELNDIDTGEDLKELYHRCVDGHKTGKNTAENLIKIEIK